VGGSQAKSKLGGHRTSLLVVKNKREKKLVTHIQIPIRGNINSWKPFNIGVKDRDQEKRQKEGSQRERENSILQQKRVQTVDSGMLISETEIHYRENHRGGKMMDDWHT